MSDSANAAPQGTDGGTPGPEGTEAPAATPTVEELLAQVEEWKGHARKHEDRAKANKDAAAQLEALQRSAMTDAEKIEADRKVAEETLAVTTKERDEAVAALTRYKIATEFGLDADDAETLSGVSDEGTIRALAERLSGRPPLRPNPNQGNRGGSPSPASTAEAFADALSDLL